MTGEEMQKLDRSEVSGLLLLSGSEQKEEFEIHEEDDLGHEISISEYLPAQVAFYGRDELSCVSGKFKILHMGR